MTDKQKIDLAKCPSNSYKDKKEEKERRNRKVDPVIKNDKIVSTKKKTSKKILETFVEDDVDDIKSYFLFDMLIPGLKNGCLDLIETMFFGNSGGRNRSRGREYNKPYSSYYRSYEGARNRRSRESERKRNESYHSKDDKIDYRNIVLRNRSDANDIVDKMYERIDEFKACSVADLFDMLDLTSNYVDNNWGWTKEDEIRVRRVSSGYLIDVPEAVYLD